jgi:TonB family protein
MRGSLPGHNRSSIFWICRIIPLLIALLGWNSFFAQEAAPNHKQLDDLALDVSGAIVKSSHRSPLRVEAAVGDFAEQDGVVTPLGVELADEFSAALSKYAKGFEVIDRSMLTGTTPVYRPSTDDLADASGAECSGKEFNSTILVTGTVNELQDRLVLWVKVQRYHAVIYDRRVTIPLTDAIKTLASEPRPDPKKIAWVNPEHPPVTNTEATKGGTKGVGYPACVYCPMAQYSDLASTAKIQGTVTLDVIISSDGFPSRILLVKGLPCGLSQQAIEGVKRWRFSPALDSDGKPVAVDQIVEVTFHMY